MPANASDPLLTNWSKLQINPIVNNTQRDPSSAWRTIHGEWRIVTYNATLYGSTNFHSWYEVGQQPGFDVGECPSFIPLPRDTPGSGPAPMFVAGKPTHVYKNSHAWADFMQVGTYTDGLPGEVGVWQPWETAFGNRSRCIDVGAMYASKDMPAPVFCPTPPFMQLQNAFDFAEIEVSRLDRMQLLLRRVAVGCTGAGRPSHLPRRA